MIDNLDFKTYRAQVWLGVGLAALAAVALTVLPAEKRIDLAAMLMMLIASIYIGFGIADGDPRHLLVEIAGAVVFGGVTMLGLWVSPYWLVAGLVLHGFYDLVHHPEAIQTPIKDWYPPFCAVVDWLVGGYLLILLLI